MIPTEINVKIDEKAIRQHIEKQLNEMIHQTLILIDVKKLADLLSMSPRFVEEEFLHDPRVRQFEVRKNKKRWYWYKQTIDAISEIISQDW